LPLGLQPVIYVAAVPTTAGEEQLIGSAGDIFVRAVHPTHLPATADLVDLLRA
jgi:hypothetical protein